MQLDQVRWGILGCGDVTEVKGGPSAMNRDDGSSRVVACMRRDGDKAADYAKRHDVARSYDSADALLADEKVNAIYVATPPNGHMELAIRAAAAGKPCYVEKPMARSFAECQRMNVAFADAKLPLFVAYYRRRLPRFVEAKRLIESGKLGDVTGIRYDFARPFQPDRDHGWRATPEVSGGGLFLDLASHLLDLFDELLGPLSNVGGTAFGQPGDDRVAMSFGQPGDIIGGATWNFAASRRADTIQIDGTEATLTMSCFGNEPLVLTPLDGEPESVHCPHHRHVQRYLMDDIIAELLGRGSCPSTGISAARTSRVMDEALGLL